MRNALIILALAGIGIIGTSMSLAENPKAEKSGIEFFHGTWEEALAKAKEESKVVFLDAYASWCGPCKILKSHVFTDAAVGEFYNTNFLNVAMDMEKGIGPQLARKYGVRAYPTLFFVNPDGSVVKQAVGYHNPEQLIALGETVVNTAP